jgi:hypothetical protein
MRRLTWLRALGYVVIATAVVSTGLVSFAQTRAVYPQLDVRVPVPPRPLIGGGSTHLAYELHITNLSPQAVTLNAVEVLDATGSRATVMRLEGAALDAATRHAGAQPDAAVKRVLGGGQTMFVFVWVTLKSGPPSALAHRFAIDWVRLHDDGRTLRGDPLKNESYRAFGANVLAVADSTVVAILDGIPENVPDPVKRAVPITPETLGGNYILLDLGDDVFAFYGHLQPGSLTVGKGDQVRRGQVLALVGNTDNSTEPHLHFHLADRASAFDAEGIPFVFSSFDIEAPPESVTPAIVPFGNSLAIDESGLARWRSSKPQPRQRELPMRNAIVSFGSR